MPGFLATLPTTVENQAKAFGAVLAFQSHIGLPAIRMHPSLWAVVHLSDERDTYKELPAKPELYFKRI